MTAAATAIRWLIRLLALVQVALGLSFWTGNFLDLLPLHMAGGALLVLSLWAMALLAAWARAPLGLAGLALLWGGLVLWLGLNQSGILPGDWHWVVRVVHLLVGLAAVGQAEQLATLIAARPYGLKVEGSRQR